MKVRTRTFGAIVGSMVTLIAMSAATMSCHAADRSNSLQKPASRETL